MTEITKGLIGEQDLNKYDGKTETFNRVTSTGGTVTLNKVGHEVDALIAYGNGNTFTQATIAAALAAIGVTNNVTLLLRPGAWAISSNADWSVYTNVTFKIVPGAVITHTTFTANIPHIEAGNYQIFNGTGAVTLGDQYANVKWFGALGDNSTTGEETAINKAIQAACANTQVAGKCHAPAGIYKTSGKILIDKYVEFYGDGRSTVFARTQSSGTDYNIIDIDSASYANVHDFTVASESATDPTLINGIHMRNLRYAHLWNIGTVGVGDKFLWLEGVIQSNFTNMNIVPHSGSSSIPIPGLSITSHPKIGVLIDDDTPAGGPSVSVANTFTNCNFDAVSDKGISLVNAANTVFNNCSTQNSTGFPMDYGVYVLDNTSINNVFISHYFGELAYGVADIYDKGNRTMWLLNRPFDVGDSSMLWVNYGDYRYFSINKGGTPGITIFKDTDDVWFGPTAANKFGVGSGDSVDWATNKNMVVYPVARPAYGATVDINLSGASAAKHHIINVTDGVAFAIRVGAGPIAEGQEATVTVYNGHTAATGTISWGAIYFLMSGWTDPAAGKRRTVNFYWDSTLRGITYNTGTHEPTIGQTLYGETSGAVIVVKQYTNAAGWAGAGTGAIYYAVTSGTVQAGEHLHEAAAGAGNLVANVVLAAGVGVLIQSGPPSADL